MQPYKEKRFVVTIDRSTAERGYVLHTIETDGSTKAQNKPLKWREFGNHFGFDPSWPHDDILPNDKVSYHADNAGGAHGKDTNDK